MVVRFARSAERQCGAFGFDLRKSADDKRAFQCPRCEVALLEAITKNSASTEKAKPPRSREENTPGRPAIWPFQFVRSGSNECHVQDQKTGPVLTNRTVLFCSG